MFINKYTLSRNNITYHHTSDTVNMSTEHQAKGLQILSLRFALGVPSEGRV